MKSRLTILVLFVTEVSCENICTLSGNTDTNSTKECEYLKKCTRADVPASPEGYMIECEIMPCSVDQDIMFDKIEGTDVGELLYI